MKKAKNSELNKAGKLGVEEGKKLGIEKSKKKIAKKMLQQGFNIKEIMDLTELTKEEIEELK